MKRYYGIFLLLSILIVASACSTTKVLQDGEYRLAKNKIEIKPEGELKPSQLEPYLKQKPNSYFIFGWNPFLNIYNWQNGKGKGWDKFVRKIGVAPVVYDPEMVDKSSDAILKHLDYQGYYHSEASTAIRVKKRRVYVDYQIFPGKRIPIKQIVLDLPDNPEFNKEFLRDTAKFGVRAGDYLSEEALEKETSLSAARMRNLGFYTFSKNNFFFEADTLTDPTGAILTMSVRDYTRNESQQQSVPLKKYTIGDVTINYPKTLKIREKVLKELTTIKPGQTYCSDVVNSTDSRLTSLKVFNSVNIGMSASDSSKVDCNISLNPAKLQGFKVNLEMSINSSGLFGISPQLAYYHKNIFGGGEWLNLNFMGNFQFKFNNSVRSNELGASAGLSFPKFFPLPYRLFKGSIPRTEVNISYNYQNRPEYTRNNISVTYGYMGNVRNRFFYQAYPIQLGIVKLVDIDEKFINNLSNDPFLKNAYQNHFDLGSGMILYYTTSTESIPTSSYFYSRLSFDIAGNLLRAFHKFMDKDESGAGTIWKTPFSQYVRAEWQIGRTWVFGKNNGQQLATRAVLGAGYAYGNSSAMPFEKHFYCGGANSLRGWQARTVGPGLETRDTTFVIPNQTGDMRLEANVEYRFKMFWKFEGAVFAEAGNVWTLQNNKKEDGSLNPSRFSFSNFGRSIAADWGVGIRLNMSFLLLRIDLGMRVHDPAREVRWVNPGQWLRKGNYALHFGVGYPF